MSNSKLVSYTKYSPSCNKPRNAKIDTITIHHMAGNLTVEQCGALFANASRETSSNYGIGSDGRVGLYVDEANRSWCSSNASNDNRAVTIEVANDGGAPDWHVSDKALSKLIELCTDICQRNGIKKLIYTGDTKGNLTMHKWFTATACPGPYLSAKFPYIAEQVNKKLSAKATAVTATATTTSTFKPYLVKVTADALNIRAGAGTSFKINGVIRDRGVYTITNEKSVSGQKWGRLKSGAGWICLSFAKKI